MSGCGRPIFPLAFRRKRSKLTWSNRVASLNAYVKIILFGFYEYLGVRADGIRQLFEKYPDLKEAFPSELVEDLVYFQDVRDAVMRLVPLVTTTATAQNFPANQMTIPSAEFEEAKEHGHRVAKCFFPNWEIKDVSRNMLTELDDAHNRIDHLEGELFRAENYIHELEGRNRGERSSRYRRYGP